MLDTVRLARTCMPELASHSLDHLARHMQLPIPPDRHRALADVRLTLAVLQRLLQRGRWSTLMDSSAPLSCRRRNQTRAPLTSPASSDQERHGAFLRIVPRAVHRLPTSQLICG
ncbi:exonuclease domain-containing protein [Amycolatopsis heterodermiae]|uniref:exonuclease domain-containing protein n=1 Tax=Amycolatopsis heterodermiae TaxID=3110235 RepID=UPI00396A8108